MVRPRRDGAISHVIPQQLVQTSNLYRWNCNVFERSRKMTAGNYVRNLSGGGPDNPCWPYQPAEARTAAGSRYPRALRPCPPCPGVLHAGDGGFAALEAGWRRVVGVSESRVVQFPRRIGGGAAVHIQRTYSNAPPESGRGIVRTRDQAFCSTPCMANIRPTMIELLSAWNSHEYATFFPDITYTSVRTMLSGRYVKKSCHW